MEFEKQLEEWMKLDYVLPEDLPNIELYMDQVTTFLEEQLKNTKRFEEEILKKSYDSFDLYLLFEELFINF